MEFTLNNKHDVKHHITITGNTDDQTNVQVIRMRNLGGTPRVVRLSLDKDIGFNDAMNKFKKLVELEDEMYEMVAEHTND